MQEIRQFPVASFRTLVTLKLTPSKGEDSALVESVSGVTLSLTELTGVLDATLLAVLEALPPQAVKLNASASRTIPARTKFLIFIDETSFILA